MHRRVRLVILRTPFSDTPSHGPFRQCSKRQAITLGDSVQFHEFIQSCLMNATNNVRRSAHKLIRGLTLDRAAQRFAGPHRRRYSLRHGAYPDWRQRPPAPEMSSPQQAAPSRYPANLGLHRLGCRSSTIGWAETIAAIWTGVPAIT